MEPVVIIPGKKKNNFFENVVSTLECPCSIPWNLMEPMVIIPGKNKNHKICWGVPFSFDI